MGSLMFKFSSIGELSIVIFNDDTIYEQIGHLSDGVDLFYGNTAESMGVCSFELTIGEMIE